MNRKKKTILNLCLIVLCLFVLWCLKGFPLPNKYELRRFEKGFLLPHGEILTEVDTRANGPIYWVGKTDGYAEVFQIRDGIIFPDNEPALYLYELYEEGTVVILPRTFLGSGELMGAWCAFLYYNIPETTGAILTLDGEEFMGELCEEGLIRFTFHHGNDFSTEFPAKISVTYLDEEGKALATINTPVSPVLNYRYDVRWTLTET